MHRLDWAFAVYIQQSHFVSFQGPYDSYILYQPLSFCENLKLDGCLSSVYVRFSCHKMKVESGNVEFCNDDGAMLEWRLLRREH